MRFRFGVVAALACALAAGGAQAQTPKAQAPKVEARVWTPADYDCFWSRQWEALSQATRDRFFASRPKEMPFDEVFDTSTAQASVRACGLSEEKLDAEVAGRQILGRVMLAHSAPWLAEHAGLSAARLDAAWRADPNWPARVTENVTAARTAFLERLGQPGPSAGVDAKDLEFSLVMYLTARTIIDIGPK